MAERRSSVRNAAYIHVPPLPLDLRAPLSLGRAFLYRPGLLQQTIEAAIVTGVRDHGPVAKCVAQRLKMHERYIENGE